MASTRTKLAFSLLIAMIYGINCLQISASDGIPEISFLLENVTSVANIAVSLLKNQLEQQQHNHEETIKFCQNEMTNHQANNNATITFLNHQIVKHDEELVNLLQCQQDNKTETLHLFQNTLKQITRSQQEKYDQVINYFLQAQTNWHESQQNHQREITVQLQTHHQTLTQISVTQSQIAETQNQMSNAFNQVVSILQMQSQQLQNITVSMNTVVSILANQRQTLDNISRSLPVVIDQQAKEIEVMSKCHHSHENNCSDVKFKLMQTASTRATVQATTTPTPIKPLIQDCSDLVMNEDDNPSGVYTITPTDSVSLDVYCDMETAGGGWTVFQKRFNGAVEFYRNWTDYEQGFGSLDGEFWLGLQHIHQLTESGQWILRIDLEDFEGNTAYAEYDSFHIGDAESNYRLSIGNDQGTAGDSMRYHDLNNMQFTTYDRDNDRYNNNCAIFRQGAWWYSHCTNSNLNGRYLGSSGITYTGMVWERWKTYQSLKKSEMKIKHV